MNYAILDIEATGGSPKRDKITEIAVFLFDGNKVIDQFSTFINPEISIPPFISQLTNITDAMVADAPTFAEAATRINEITSDAIFVAHNVEFDYAYLRSEFKRLGINFRRQKLCTVDLAKELMPEMASYNLGNLCTELDIKLENAHRAISDARATVKLFEKILERGDEERLYNSITEIVAYKNLPSHLPKEVLDPLPEETGNYFFHNKEGEVIFVGRSGDVRRRILQYVAGRSARFWRMLKHTYEISFIETGSELVAQILEFDKVKQLRPNYNRRARRYPLKWGIYKVYQDDGYIRLEIDRRRSNMPLLGFESEEEAHLELWNKIRKYKLCPVLCSVAEPNEEKNGACIAHLNGQCRGACVTKESAKNYNKRVNQVFKDFDFPSSNFLIVGDGRVLEEKSIIRVENELVSGYGYVEAARVDDLDYVTEQILDLDEYPETTRMVKSYLRKNKLDKIVVLSDEVLK